MDNHLFFGAYAAFLVNAILYMTRRRIRRGSLQVVNLLARLPDEIRSVQQPIADSLKSWTIRRHVSHRGGHIISFRGGRHNAVIEGRCSGRLARRDRTTYPRCAGERRTSRSRRRRAV
jgi:hypothetical protein